MACRCPLGRPSADVCPQCLGREMLKNLIRTNPLVKPKPKARPAASDRKQNTLVPCIHRGEPAGKINCGCQGAKEVYRCTKLIRPTAAAEPAYCVMYRPVKYFGITATDGTKIDAHEIPLSEIAICQPGKCDLYEPATNAR